MSCSCLLTEKPGQVLDNEVDIELFSRRDRKAYFVPGQYLLYAVYSNCLRTELEVQILLVVLGHAVRQTMNFVI